MRILNSLKIGGSNQVDKVLSGSTSLNFGSIAAESYLDLDITVTGAGAGDPCLLGIPNGSVGASSIIWGFTNTNKVTVRHINRDDTNAFDPAAGTFKVYVFKVS